MNLFQSMLSIFRRESDKSGKSDLPVLSARSGAMPLLGYGDTAAMNVAAVYRCVKLLSESVANLPVQYLKRRGDIFAEEDQSRLGYLLNVQPDAAVNAFDFWRRAVQNMLLEGNAYIIPFYGFEDDKPQVCRLALCGRHTVSHDTVNDRYSVSDPVNGIFGTYDENEVIHLKGMEGCDSKRGVSVLTYARMTMGIAAAGDKETHNRFVNGGNVRGLLSDGIKTVGYGKYQDEELQRAAVDIDSRFSAGQHVVSLPGHVDFKQISLSSTDMQFLESRKFTVREICRFFGVHPSFVFDDTSNNYKSAEQANVAFLSHTLNPLLRSIETELTRKLISPAAYRRYRIRFDRRGLYACDLESKARYQTARLGNGTATVNELRSEENLPRVAGGDKILVSANLRCIDEIAETEEDKMTAK